MSARAASSTAMVQPRWSARSRKVISECDRQRPRSVAGRQKIRPNSWMAVAERKGKYGQRFTSSGRTMNAVFITSTGTGIGKTFVTAGLVRYFRDKARSVEACKPVISSFDPSAPEASDTGILLSALGRGVTEAEIERVSPWRFAAPLSPNMAAGRPWCTDTPQASVVFRSVWNLSENWLG